MSRRFNPHVPSRRSLAERKSAAARRLLVEALEPRLLLTVTPPAVGLSSDVPAINSPAVPGIVFDSASGRLAILGNSLDNEIRQGMSSDGFLEITLDGVSRSARPDSLFYDAALAGATRQRLRSIVLQGGGGNDRLVLADQELTGKLEVVSDGALSIAGTLHVGQNFHATATTIEVAGSVVSYSGTVRLLSSVATIVSGSIDVSASGRGIGGRAEILGPVVALVDTAAINASGALGGGVILVGGDFQGRNPDVPTAQHTYVSADSALTADASQRGQGGQIIVWADTATRYFGNASARGGNQAGDGGLIEVSGKEHLVFRGSADLGAAHGQLGTLLLDPTNLVIANGTADSAADGTATFSGNPSGIVGSLLAGDTGPSTIYESELQGLAATANIVLQATNNVTINDLTDNTLGLAATTGSLTIRADADGDGNGNFSMNSGDTIRTQGGAVSIRGASLTAIGTINTTGSAGIAGGSVTLTADNGLINIVGAITTTGGSNANAGSVTLTASGTVTVSGAITSSGGTYVAGNPGRNAGAVSLTGSSVSVAAITTAGTSAASGGNAGGSGGVIMLDATAGTITLGGNLTSTGGNGNGAGLGGNAGSITLSDAVVLTGNRVLSAVGGTGGTAGSGGNIQLLAAVDGNVAATRTLTLTGGTGDVSVAGAVGATLSLSALTITGNDISLANIGGTSAGVSGATAVTATTAGADTGSIAFTGTTYNANAQTYTAPSGQTLLLNAGATTTFTSTADAVTFTTGTLLLSDGSNLVVSTAGGAISALGGIRGSSLETVTLNAGATTLAVGAIGNGDEIASVALTATTATLSGDVTTGDVAGNNVSITGAVTLNHAVGTTLTIDSENAANDGAITITGAITSTARHLVLTGGSISAAAITTTGGSNQNGGAVTLSASGIITVSGTITTSGGTYLASNPGRNAGAVSITGSSLSVAAITTTGRTATTSGFDGGSGGSILLDATVGTITLGGDLTTTGGNGNGAGLGGNAGNIVVSDAASITANRILTAVGGTGAIAGAGGNIQLLGTVDSSSATARTLTVTAGSGDVTLADTVGATFALSALTVTGNDISLASIGGATAGVTGATAVTATTAGADIGSIAFTGTTYNANAQTYTAPSGQNLLLNAGATTTFTSTADAVTFTTGTLLLGDGSNLVVTTAGGAISAVGGIRGNSLETVTLNAGATTLAVGAIGSGDEIASVSLTATTATLSGDIVTGDIAGNNVTITGAVTLNHAVGTTLTIDTDNGANDGAISISGTITGATRHLVLTGGAVSTAAITTTGGSNQDGGSVTLSASGAIAVGGTITASAGTYLAGNPGRNAGAVSIAGSSLAVAAITAAGTSATSGGNSGGNGGSILLDATAGSITLGGNLTTTGGNGNGAGLGGNAGSITLSDAVVLTGNRVLSAVGGTGGTAGSGGNLQLLGTVDGDVAATRTLTLTGGTGDVTLAGAVGAAASLSALTITGNDISLVGIGSSTSGVSGATSVTAATAGADIGSIQLSGTLRTTGTQTYSGAGITTIAADLLTTNATITVGNAVVLAGDSSLSAGTGSAVFSSTVDLAGFELVLTADEVDFAANVTGGGGTLEILPGTIGTQLRVGGAGTAGNRLDLTSVELALIQPGLSRLTLGRSDSTAIATVNAVNLVNPARIRSGSALMTVAGSVTSTSDLELNAGTGGIALNGAINLGAHDLTLASSGGVTQTAAITAAGLEVLGSGTFTLSLATNDVGTLAADLSGSINYRDASDLTVGTVHATAGIATGGPSAGGSVTINAAGFLTVDQAIDTSAGSGGTLTTTGTVINAAPVLGAGSIVLSGLNHAPSLSGANNLAEINEDDVTNGGTLVASILSGFASDLDAGALTGIAVTAVDNTSGQWQYSTNGGSNWTAFGSPTQTTARLLAADSLSRVRFVPNANWNGTVASGFTFRAWDQSTGSAGGTANVTTNGGTTAFSAATAAAGITVAAVNDPPAGSNSTIVILEDTTYAFTAADFGFSDPSDSPPNSLAAVRIATLPAAGSLTNAGVAVTAGQTIALSDINSGNLRFTPATDGNGASYASFTFQVQDDGGTANGGGDLDPTANTLTIDVIAVDDPPSGSSGTVTTLEDTEYVFAVVDFGFSDPQDSPANDLLAVRITTLPTAGTLTNGGVAVTGGQFVAASDISSGNLRFTPVANAHGAGYASFTFQVQDDGDTANGGVDLDPTPNVLTIDVLSVNDPPAGTDRTVTTLEDSPYVFSAADFGLTDPSDSPANQLLALRIASLPTAGSLTNGGVAVVAGQFIGLSDLTGGNLRFTPVANANGTAYASFTFQVQDDGGTANGGTDLDPSSGVLTIDVTAVNDPPTGTDQTVTMLEDTPYTFSTADFGFSDPQDIPANNLFAVRIGTLPAVGTLTSSGVAVTAGQSILVSNILAGNLRFTPAANANGNSYASFTFQVQDDGGTANGGSDLDPTAGTLTIDVTPVNDTPIAAGDSYTASAETQLVVVASGVLSNDSDVEGTPLSAVLASGPASGTLSLNSDGSFTYTPTTGFVGTDSFTYRASDGTVSSNLATVTITVQPVSHQIIAVGAASGPAGASRPTVHVYDAVTNALKFVIPASATYGVNNANGIRVAVGDIDGDGFADIITAPGRNTRPDIKIFRGTPLGGLQGTLLATIPATSTFGNSFVGGVNLAVGDVDGDGAIDIVLAADQGKATIKVFHNRRLESSTGSLFVQSHSFDAFSDISGYNGGGRIAVGNLTGGPQSARELVVATGAGTAGKFRLFNLAGASPVRMWTKSDPTGFTGGLFVATGDVNGNGLDDIVTSTGPNGSGRIRVYNHGGTQLSTFLPFAAAENQQAAVRVTLRDIDGDGRAELFAAQGQDGRSGYKVKKFNALTAELVDQFFATGPDFAGGGLNIG